MTKEALINSLVLVGALKSPAVIEAFQKVDRKDFVPAEYADEAYDDYPLPIGHGQTISQPYTVAFMLELLLPKPGEKALDVGSGSGWTTALLAYMVGQQSRNQNAKISAQGGSASGGKSQNRGMVFGVEKVSELVKFGRANLAKYKFPHAAIEKAGVERGVPIKAPFDKILVSAAAETLPQELIRQLKVGGVLVVPVQNSIWKINRISETEIDEEEYPGFSFVPLR